MKTVLATLLALLIAVPCYAAPADDLILITEEYPPLNFTEYGLHRGIATDLLVEILAATGSLKSHKDIASLPWARGYQMVRKQKNLLLFSMTRTSSRESQFHWVGPILQSEIVLLARKESQLKLDNLQQLQDRNLKVGVVLDDVGHLLLTEQNVSNRQIYPLNQGVQLAKMLAEKRFDLIAYDALVSRWNLSKLGFDPEDYEVVYSLQKANYYFALNLETDPTLVTRLQKELDRLTASGRLQTIIKGYLN